MEINPSILGLNSYELKAYFTLTKFGSCTASILAKESNVPYGRIYDVLNNLEKKCLIRIIPDKTKKYTIANSEFFTKLVQTKIEQLIGLKKEISEIQKINEEKIGEVVELGRGREGFLQIVKDKPEPEHTMFTLRSDAAYKSQWEASLKRYRKDKVKTKALIGRQNDTLENIKKVKKIHPNIKHFESSDVGFQVIDEKEVIICLDKSNVTLRIKDEPLANLMKKLFLLAYDNSEEI